MTLAVGLGSPRLVWGDPPGTGVKDFEETPETSHELIWLLDSDVSCDFSGNLGKSLLNQGS